MKKPVRVTDHAVLRYLERVGGFDIEGLRRNMAQRVEQAMGHGLHTIKVDGHKFVIRANPDAVIVVTVLDKHCGGVKLRDRE